MSQHVAHEVAAAALQGRVQALRDGSLQPLMGIRDDELDAAQTAPRELAQEVSPEGLGLRRADRQAQHPRLPSSLTPTATITATETMRPSRRAFTWVASSQIYAHSPSRGRSRKAAILPSISPHNRLT